MFNHGNEKNCKADIYIDLGTANTLVVSRAKGFVANEPSVIAFRDLGGGRKRVVAVGDDAKAKMGKTPGSLTASFPLKDGVIADLDATEAMLRYFIAKGRQRFSFSKPRVVISLPYGVSDVEIKAVRDVGLAAGAGEVFLIEEPMAAAIGAGLPVEAPKGNMVIDIGGGTTEVAIISLYGVVHCEAVRVGGHAFDEAIVEFMRRRHNLVVGIQTAEKIKIEIGSALAGDRETSAAIRGVDFVTGLPREMRVSAQEIHEAINPLLNEIINAGRRALEAVPPDLLPDIILDGARVAGGGALLHGIDERIQAELKIPIFISDEPLLAIARGGEKSIQDSSLLAKVLIEHAR